LSPGRYAYLISRVDIFRTCENINNKDHINFKFEDYQMYSASYEKCLGGGLDEGFAKTWNP
jgi:hypothetical protein